MTRFLFYSGLTALLIAPLIAERNAAKSPDQAFQTPLPKNEQILHALNRLTFGPRPGDMEAVSELGLKTWIDQQLHPEKIAENPVLEQKLAPLQSLNMDNRQLVENYPPPQYIIAVATGHAAMPEDPEKRAVIQRLAAKYRARIQKKGGDVSNLEPIDKSELAELLTPVQIRMLHNGSPEDKAELLRSLPPEKLQDIAFALPAGLRGQLLVAAPVEIRRQMLLYAAPQQVLAHDLAESKIYRAVYSNRQLEEVLTDFWFNHFNIYLDKGADHFLVTEYERDAIRPFVLGKFRDLLEATAKSPAMMFYLDNWQSVSPNAPTRAGRLRNPQAKTRKRGINENYARELMELHTLGVDGGYTQKDVTEVARCFTGWTIRDPYRGAHFDFNPRVHDDGEKTVLGVKIPAGGGIRDGERVLDILSRHSSTARFLSRSLAIRFVSDNPPQSLVDAMANTFLKTGGELREVMKTMLNSREFWSEGAYRAKVKSPLEMVASAVRASGADVTFAFGLAHTIEQLGEPLYRKQEPTGYSNKNDEWVNSASLLGRMNFAIALADNKIPGVKVNEHRWESDPDALSTSVLFAPASTQTRAAMDKGLEEKRDPATIAGLILGSPDFQRR